MAGRASSFKVRYLTQCNARRMAEDGSSLNRSHVRFICGRKDWRNDHVLYFCQAWKVFGGKNFSARTQMPRNVRIASRPRLVLRSATTLLSSTTNDNRHHGQGSQAEVWHHPGPQCRPRTFSHDPQISHCIAISKELEREKVPEAIRVERGSHTHRAPTR